MATITSIGSGKWSVAGTWDTGVPADNDTVVIAAGHSVEFDVDQSGFANGIAGLTITSHATTPGMLFFNVGATTKHLKIKTGTTINGTNAATKGRLLCNSDGAWATGDTRHPFASKVTIECMTTGYIDGTYLDIKILCAEPANPIIRLSADEAIGQTELSVDTNVTGDIWAAGDTVSICDLQKAQEHETRVIAAGGIAASTITVTAGLTAAKTAGNYPCIIALATRNVKIIGGSGSSQKCIANAVNARVDAWMYCATAGQGFGFDACTGLTVDGGYYGVGPTSGWASGWSRGFHNSTVTWSGGTSSGNSSVFHTCGVIWSNGTSAGNTNAFNLCSVTWTGGTSSGNSTGFYLCTVIWSGGTSSGNSNGFYTCTVTWSGGTSSGNNNGFNNCTVTCSNTTSNDTTAFRRCPFVTLTDVSLLGATEFVDYNNEWTLANGYVLWHGVDGTASAIKTLSKGGITESETITVPTGYTQGLKLTCESATFHGFYQEPVTIMPGETLRVRGYIKIADDHSTYPPRLEIIDQGSDPIVSSSYTSLDSDIVSGTETGWQEVVVSYKNTGSIPKLVWVRLTAKRASGDVYFAWTKDGDYPDEADVRDGVDYQFAEKIGMLKLPVVGKVRTGTSYGAGGIEFSGTDVLPGASNVVDGIGYGANGTEYTGTFAQNKKDKSPNIFNDGIATGDNLINN